MRFGYFSIKYPSHVGDQFYSIGKKLNLDENKHVRTEPRNMFPKSGKKGKGPDVYFKNMVYEDADTQKRVREIADKDHQQYIERAKSRKKGAQSADGYKAQFRPTGPQEYVEL